MEPRTFCLAGHARLPKGVPEQNMYESITMTVEVDQKYSVIVDASCTLSTPLGRDYVNRMLRGYCLEEDMQVIVQNIHQFYQGKIANALVAAVRDVYLQYEQLKARMVPKIKI